MPRNPAELAEPDAAWAQRGAEALARVADALADLPGAGEATFDHIGSTAVPELAAKPFIDLQVRILPLPSHAELTRRLAPLGYRQAVGSRPDSPGVSHDIPRPGDDQSEAVYEKRLYVAENSALILHVRRADSPWGLYTVWFRDWLRQTPQERVRYQATKRHLAAANSGKPDYDDYTRAKTAFFDEVHPVFCAWAQSGEMPSA